MITLGIPFYNSERYILPLVDSLNGQTCKDFQIVFVDNNSQDRTRELIEARINPSLRYRFIEEKRQGIAYCRNDILDEAEDRICFVDSDDAVDPDYVSEMKKLSGLSDLGIVQPVFFKDSIPERDRRESRIETLAGDAYRRSYLYAKDICLWNKVFFKEVIKKNGIRFDVRLKIGEDADFVLKYGRHVEKVAVSQRRLYFYRESEDSTYGKFLASNDGKDICEGLISIYSNFRLEMDPNSMAYVGCTEFEIYYLRKLYLFYELHEEKEKKEHVKREIKTLLKELTKKNFVPWKIKAKLYGKRILLNSYLRKGFRD